ncbi:MAG TPA: VOC family protein [Gammaproteobacteria bacterium]|nr:VOC family protein [Gammaproteobacteria bacterium]
MPAESDHQPGRFCWVDLAAADARGAADFYRGLFGWQTRRQRANGGEFLHFMAGGEPVASLYQLGSRQIAAGVPSHWTPYIAVSDIDESASNVETLGGRVVVKPFSVDGIARIGLVTDSAGALVGLWENVK